MALRGVSQVTNSLNSGELSRELTTPVYSVHTFNNDSSAEDLGADQK